MPISPVSKVWGWVGSWNAVTLLVGILIGGIVFGVLGMTPPQYQLAKVGLVTAAVILALKVGWWLYAEEAGQSVAQRLTLFIALFGLIGFLCVESVRWVHQLEIHLAPIVTIQLSPGVDETHPESAMVTGAMIIFVNNRKKAISDFDQLILLPPIKEASVPDQYRTRLKIISGDSSGSTFLHFQIRDFRPGEHFFADVQFLTADRFKSTDDWSRQYGYNGENVLVDRVFVGPEQRLDK